MVYVLLADGFEEVEALSPIDILLRGGLSVKKISMTGKRAVTGSHGISVLTDDYPEKIGDDCDLLILPGGMPGASSLDAYEGMTALCQRVLAKNGRIADICAAPMILGRRGLLKGRHATAFPGFERFLEGAILSEQRVVTDGPFTTAVGMGAATDFGLELLSLLTNDETALRVKNAAFLPDNRYATAKAENGI